MAHELSPSESSEWFQRIYQHAAMGMAITDVEGRFVQCNPAYCALLGYSEEELKRLGFAGLVHPDDRNANLLLVRRLLEGEIASFSVDNRYLHRSGAPVWVQKYVSLLPDAAGRPAYLFALVTNITERREAEATRQAALARAETEHRRLAAVLDAIPVGVGIADAAGDLVQFNRAFEALWAGAGQPFFPEQYRQRRGWWQRTGQPVAMEEWPLVRALHEGAVIQGDAIEIGKFDGSSRATIVATAAPIRDPEGRIVGSVVAQVDLTRQQQAEEALQATEATFRATFENAAVGIAHVNTKNRFIRANGTLARITGYPREELLTKTFSEITHPEDLGADLDQLARLTAGEIDTYAMEKRYVRKDGSIVWVNLTGSAVRDAAGAILFFIAIVEEITRRRAAEAELRTAQQRLQEHTLQLESAVRARTNELQEMVKELETFSYSVSHDLRAPLRTIMGFSDLLKVEAGAQLPAGCANYLDRIMRAGRRADALVTDILQYSKVSRVALTIEDVDVESAVRAVVETLGRGAAIGESVQVSSPLPRVKASRAALQQCLANLIGNALKFTRPGVPPRVVVRGEAGRTGVKIVVEDNGIGIAPEHHQKVWGMFERLDPRYEGTGVGLSIVRRAVERMGGRAGFASTVGQGSSFWIELPAA